MQTFAVMCFLLRVRWSPGFVIGEPARQSGGKRTARVLNAPRPLVLMVDEPGKTRPAQPAALGPAQAADATVQFRLQPHGLLPARHDRLWADPTRQQAGC